MNKIFVLSGALLLSGTASLAQVMDHATMNHDIASAATPAPSAGRMPTEAGQSAYAALGEAVRMMLADPRTDWSKADVDALRNHLVDMDNVTLRAQVQTTRLPNGAKFTVTGERPVVGSIQRMTSLHFAQPDFNKPWTMHVERIANGADVTVVSSNPADAAQINGLGFFGILTMGSHHQPHHLMMAEGQMHH
jgi:hypothetical protein